MSLQNNRLHGNTVNPAPELQRYVSVGEPNAHRFHR